MSYLPWLKVFEVCMIHQFWNLNRSPTLLTSFFSKTKCSPSAAVNHLIAKKYWLANLWAARRHCLPSLMTGTKLLGHLPLSFTSYFREPSIGPRWSLSEHGWHRVATLNSNLGLLVDQTLFISRFKLIFNFKNEVWQCPISRRQELSCLRETTNCRVRQLTSQSIRFRGTIWSWRQLQWSCMQNCQFHRWWTVK